MSKKSKLKDAKFFCESCGSEVPRNAKVCPVCGKFFAAVRCPQCGRTGTSDEFKNGCPSCGYAVDLTSYFLGQIDDEETPKNKKEKKRKQKNKFNNIAFTGYKDNTTSKNSSYSPDSSLPVWIYVVTIVVFIILCICLYSCL